MMKPPLARYKTYFIVLALLMAGSGQVFGAQGEEKTNEILATEQVQAAKFINALAEQKADTPQQAQRVAGGFWNPDGDSPKPYLQGLELNNVDDVVNTLAFIYEHQTLSPYVKQVLLEEFESDIIINKFRKGELRSNSVTLWIKKLIPAGGPLEKNYWEIQECWNQKIADVRLQAKAQEHVKKLQSHARRMVGPNAEWEANYITHNLGKEWLPVLANLNKETWGTWTVKTMLSILFGCIISPIVQKFISATFDRQDKKTERMKKYQQQFEEDVESDE